MAPQNPRAERLINTIVDIDNTINSRLRTIGSQIDISREGPRLIQAASVDQPVATAVRC
jgi:hypothetical protein